MRRIDVRPRARRDLLTAASYLLEFSGVERAKIFLECVSETFSDLARIPLIGTSRKWKGVPSRDLRMWRVRNFEEYLIFYSVTRETIKIERVIHAKLDYQRQFRSG